MRVNVEDIEFDNPINDGSFGTYYYKGVKFTGIVYEGKIDDMISESEIKDGRQNGYEKCFYPSGELESEIYFKDGYEDGIAKYFYKNGNLKEKILFQSGNGVWYETYDENGILIKREED